MSAVLEAMAAKTKKKSDTPEVDCSAAEATDFEKYKEIKAKIKILEADARAIADLRMARLEACRIVKGADSGAAQSSLKCGPITYITYMTEQQYITEDAADILRVDGYGKHVEECFVIQLDAKKLDDKQLETLASLGAVVTKKIRLKPTYYSDVSIGRIEPHEAASFVRYIK